MLWLLGTRSPKMNMSFLFLFLSPLVSLSTLTCHLILLFIPLPFHVFVWCASVYWMFKCVWAHVWVSVHMYLCAYGGPRLMLRIIFDLSPTVFIEAKSLNQTKSWAVYLVSMASLVWGIPCLCLLCWNYK